MKRIRRSLSLIADFKNGFASGWFFAVGECFKDQLDIRFTERVEQIVIDGIPQYDYIQRDGKIIKKKQTKLVHRWTQGDICCFDLGHRIYDHPLAKKSPWREALSIIGFSCSVINASADLVDKDGTFIDGQVEFEISRPDERKMKLIHVGNFKLTQHQFVEFLKTGELNGHAITDNYKSDQQLRLPI